MHVFEYLRCFISLENIVGEMMNDEVPICCRAYKVRFAAVHLHVLHA